MPYFLKCPHRLIQCTRLFLARDEKYLCHSRKEKSYEACSQANGLLSSISLRIAWEARPPLHRPGRALPRRLFAAQRLAVAGEHLSAVPHTPGPRRASSPGLPDQPHRQTGPAPDARRHGPSQRTQPYTQLQRGHWPDPCAVSPRLQLELASTFLHDPGLSIEEVARKCGFEDARHFRRLWQRTFGVPSSVSRAIQNIS